MLSKKLYVINRGYGPLLLVKAAMTRVEIETIKDRKKEFSGFRLIFLIISLQDRCYPDVAFYGEQKSGKSFI